MVTFHNITKYIYLSIKNDSNQWNEQTHIQKKKQKINDLTKQNIEIIYYTSYLIISMLFKLKKNNKRMSSNTK